MADTVTDTTPETLKAGTATGFSFEPITAAELIACARRAIALYGQPIPWRKLQANAMRQDFSWRNSAQRYAALYDSLVRDSQPEDEAVAATISA